MFKVSDKNNRRTEYGGHVLACLNVVQPVTVSLSLYPTHQNLFCLAEELSAALSSAAV